jgi:plastocyanin
MRNANVYLSLFALFLFTSTFVGPGIAQEEPPPLPSEAFPPEGLPSDLIPPELPEIPSPPSPEEIQPDLPQLLERMGVGSRPESDPHPASQPNPLAGLNPTRVQKEFTLVAGMIGDGANVWLPSTILTKMGTTVSLTLRNASKKEHGFAIDELGIKETIPAGESRTVALKNPPTGLWRYYCPLHEGHIGGQLLAF